ncbi:MAG: hypothetical protein ABFS46_05230 [Myxococcota bacterium]
MPRSCRASRRAGIRPASDAPVSRDLPRRRPPGRFGWGAGFGLFLGLVAQPGAAAVVDYLHVRANEGESSGGHAAIRFGESTFHFQHHRGLVRLLREDSQRFQHRYRTLQNRDIELTRVSVSEETGSLLETAFRRRHLVQERQLEILGAMEADARLFAALLARERGDTPVVNARGVGFFFPGQAAAEFPAVLVVLRERIRAAHGRGFLSARRGEVEVGLAEWIARPLDVEATPIDPEHYPAVPPSSSERYQRLLAARAALALLERPAPLHPGVRVGEAAGAPDPARSVLTLRPSERARLASMTDALLDATVRLAASPRSDWGPPLLLSMARLVALEESAREGRLVLLETFPPAAEQIEVDQRRLVWLPELLAEASVELEAARARVFDVPGWSEAEYNGLEAAATRWSELRAAAAGAGTIRIHVGAMIPEGRGPVASLPLPKRDPVPLALRLEESRQSLERYRSALAVRSGYHLLERNCVTEIFRTLELALVPAAFRSAAGPVAQAERLQRESTHRLGGYVHPTASLNFIPFVSAQHVQESYRVVQRSLLPSYRHHRLSAMARQESPLRVALRESNVLTSTLHTPSERDGFFLFFTDGGAGPRPLLGALNLAGGLARSAVGLFELPFDGGRSLRSGLVGAFWSLPELLFQNIRKGSNDYVRPEQRPPAG